MEKHYTNGTITIVWKPELCIHSGVCVKTLPAVYHPKDHPWITPQHADTNQLINQINNCPSGTLSYFLNEEDSIS